MEGADDSGPALIVGLGNPGQRYEGTRHNVGFRVVAELARRSGFSLGSSECNSLVGEDDRVILAQPLTYMNRSGHAVRCLLERRRIESSRLLVVYDDVWLPLARLRARSRGGPGGHRGMESIVNSVRSPDVARLRVGVGWEGGPPADVDLVEYVLQPFPASDRESVEAMVERASDACEYWLERGIDETMTRFNG